MLRRLVASLVVCVVPAMFASCSADEPSGAALAEGCLINSDCTTPLVCAFRRCHNECKDSRDCAPGQRCVASDRPFKVCQLAQEKQCTTNAECPVGMVCGVDSQCRDACASSRDCIAGQLCVSGTCADRTEVVDGGLPVVTHDGGTVSAPCVYSSDCPEPLVCRNGACLVECREDRDCDYFASCIGGRCRLGVLPNADASAAGGTSSGGSANGGAAGTGATAGAGGTSGSGGGVVGPPGGLLDCKTRGTAGATIADTTITADQTWSGTIHVTETVNVYNGAVLTIAPGTNIVVDAGRGIDIGWNTGAATIVASGTAAKPITFCGAAAAPGNWSGLILEQNVTSTSVLANVLISDGGGLNAGFVLDTNATLNNVQVRNSGTDGVWATDFHTGSAALTVDGAVGVPVVLKGEGAVEHFPLGGALTGNGTDLAKVDFGYIDADTTFHDLGIPYLEVQSLNVQGAATVTFDPGVEYRVASAQDLEIGWNGGGATISVDGTAQAPVTFRGETAEAGNWTGILIDANVTSGSHLRYAKILHAGKTGPALDVRAPITLDNVSLDTNKAGVKIAAGGLNSDSKMLSVTRTSDVPLTIAPNAIVSLPTGGTFTGNTTDQILVTGSDYFEGKGTMPNLGIPYYFDGSFNMDGGASLQIQPGVTFIMTAGALVEVGWNSSVATLVAQGTAAAPITFRGLDATNGYWGGIMVRPTVLSTSLLDHVVVKNAGPANGGGITLNREIPVTNSTVSGSAGYGIYYKSTFTTNYATSNTLTGNAQGPTGTF